MGTLKLLPREQVQNAGLAGMIRCYFLPVAVAAVAYALHYLPFAPFKVTGDFGVRRPVSAAILAIVAGAVVRNVTTVSGEALRGSKSIVKRVIPWTIVLIGASLSAHHVATVGWRAAVVILLCLGFAMAAAWLIGRLLGVETRTSLLIGAGTAICGNSAIIAVAPMIDAGDEDLFLSVGTINLLGLVMMFSAPALGVWMGMNDQQFAVWSGTTIHAVPQVVAAGFAFSQKAGALATLVKLVRVAMLAPLLLVIAFAAARRGDRTKQVDYRRLVPLFLWGFLGLFALNSLGWLPFASQITEAGEILLTLSMAAMGLEVSLRSLLRVGGPALATGAATCAALCGASWGLILWLL
ncbi:MAG: putative sulfate exporter family transporter [Bryobacteraceae bacterium]